eukprot:gene4477-4720_t
MLEGFRDRVSAKDIANFPSEVEIADSVFYKVLGEFCRRGLDGDELKVGWKELGKLVNAKIIELSKFVSPRTPAFLAPVISANTVEANAVNSTAATFAKAYVQDVFGAQ